MLKDIAVILMETKDKKMRDELAISLTMVLQPLIVYLKTELNIPTIKSFVDFINVKVNELAMMLKFFA